MKTVFLGWDSKESLAYEVARHSIKRRSLEPVEVNPIKHKMLRSMGLFTRTWKTDSLGQVYDELSGESMSTEFSFTRFLVPHLARLNDRGPWVLFADCDILCLNPIDLVWQLADDTKAIMVVKHNYNPGFGMKMDNVIQTPYQRKLWSSVILWNVNHPANLALTPEKVNTMPAKWLHNFGWLKDDEIGELPTEWNFIPGHNDLIPNPNASGYFQPSIIHYTEGTPMFKKYENAPLAELWRREESHYLEECLTKPSSRIRL